MGPRSSALAIAFAGTFLFVVFVGLMAAEFSRGTIRTMLLRQPRRTALLAGKLAAMLTFAAGTLAAHRGRHVDRGAPAGPGRRRRHGRVDLDRRGSASAVTDYGAVLLWITGYAVLGHGARGARALGAGRARRSASRGPGRSSTSCRTRGPAPAAGSPGLLLEAFAGGGTSAVSAGRAIATVAVYATAAAIVAVTVFRRRDVTS